ncbi:MAG: hypothetical protein GY920_16855 [Aliivibrio sp.]|nr:hypothetical protein [Aliivibrio sp.]
MTPQERRMLEALVDSQMRVEMLVAQIASRPTGGLSSALMRIKHEDPLNSPLIFDREERIALGEKIIDESQGSVKKAKRKVSGYQREFGRQLKKLKKKHPRTKISRLMKRAHTATKKARR